MGFVENVNKLAQSMPDDVANTLTELQNQIDVLVEDVSDLDDAKVNKVTGYGLTKNDFSDIYKSKLDGIEEEATKNSSDSYLLNRNNHTGNQSVDTLVESSTGKIMTAEERTKLDGIANEANKYVHPSTHPASIIDGSAYPNLFVKADTSGTVGFDYVAWSEIAGKPSTFTPSSHNHSMSEITSGNLDANRITTSSNLTFVTTTEKSLIGTSEQISNKGIANGYCPLDSNGKINASFLNDLQVIDVFQVDNEVEMLLLSTANVGDICFRNDVSIPYMLVQSPYSDVDNWKSLSMSVGVSEWNGLTGTVSVTTSDLPEGTNLYFTNERVDDRVGSILTAGTNVSISYDDNTGFITINANDTNVVLGTDTTGDYVSTITQGNGIVITGGTGETSTPTISHADTSSQSSVDNSNGSVIQDITLDTFGHITAIGSVNLDGRYYTETEVQTSLPKIGLDTSNTTQPSVAGQIAWNQDERTVDICLNGVVLQTGQETLLNVRNNTASTISNGTVVMATGTLGASGRITVSPANTTDAKYVIGIATEDILSGSDGFVTAFGKVRGINTSAWSQGTVLYLGSNGALTSTEPTTGLKMPIAIVINSHATVGTVFVRVTPIDENSWYTRTQLDSANLLRADKYLANQNLAAMIYSGGNLTKIQYNNATDVNYEVLNYTSGALTSINHYINSTLAGTSTLSYTSGALTSVIFVEA